MKDLRDGVILLGLYFRKNGISSVGNGKEGWFREWEVSLGEGR